MTSNQENQAPNADELSAEIVALRERVAELEAGATLGLNWREIPEDVERLLVEEVPVLTHVKSLDVKGALPSSSAHILIEGDNLHALYTLQATHKGRVDVISIDPPYNTGNEFIYNDKLIDKENRWRHSAWLSFMHKRLVLAGELLSDTGLIFINIDDNEQARLRLLCDSVFGEANFIACLIWQGKSGGQDAKTFNRLHEYVLVYAKDIEQAAVLPLLSEADISKFPHVEASSGRHYKTQLARKWGSNSLRSDRPNLWYAVKAPDGKDCWPLHSDGTEGCWRWSKKKFEAEIAAGNIEFSKDSKGRWVAYQRIWAPADGETLARPRSSMVPIECGTTAGGSRELKSILGKGNGFSYPKPTGLVKWVLESSANADAIILDFFAGSGTTLHSVAELNAEDDGNRQCILVTNNESGICRDVTQPRCKAVLTGKWADGKHEPLPGSLRFYTTSFMKRRRSPDRMRMDVAAHTVDLVAVREMVIDEVKVSDDLVMLFGDGRSIAVVPTFDADHKTVCALADKQVRDGDERRAYLFTWNSHGIEPEVAALWPGWEVQPLPAEMLAELRNLAPARNLFDEAEALS